MPPVNGLETPPATPELELERRLGGLTLKDRAATTDTPLPTSAPRLLPTPLSPTAGAQGDPMQAAAIGLSSPPLAAATAADPPPSIPAAADGSSEAGDGDDAADGAPFRFFPALPAELRIKIWKLSFEPRVVELHTRRLHYANDFRHGGRLKWQSQSANPAALAVCVEAREVALAHYYIALPLAVANRPSWLACGDDVADLNHHLYFNPREDTVVLLGEVDLRKLNSFFDLVRTRAPPLCRMRRLGLSAGCFRATGSSAILTVYSKTVFRELDELVLFMYADAVPPDQWKKGSCVLEACEGKDFFRRWEMAGGSQLKKPDGSWIVVGRNEIAIRDLIFAPGR